MSFTLHGQKGPKPQLHISAMSMLFRCGEAFRRRYIEGHKIPPSIAALVGSSVDAAVNNDLTAKRDQQILLPNEQIDDIARDHFVHKLNRDGVRIDDPEDAGKSLEEIAGDGIDRSIRLARLHHVAVAPTIKPIHIQRPLTIELADFPVDLAMTLDVEEEDRIRDTKTKKVSPQADTAEKSDQLTMYAMGRRVRDGIMPAEVALDFLVDLKTPKAVTLTSTRSPQDFHPLMHRVEAAVGAIERGNFLPANPDNWWCSKRWCGYWATCRFVRHPVAVAAPPDNLEEKLRLSIEHAKHRMEAPTEDEE